MISFNVMWFGYGAGLVMCGWIAGMIIGVALGVLGRMGKLGVFVLGLLLVDLSGSSHAALSTVQASGLVAGTQYVCTLQLTASGDSLGSVFGGAGSVGYAVPASPGSASVQ